MAATFIDGSDFAKPLGLNYAATQGVATCCQWSAPQRVVLEAVRRVRPEKAGQASGATNATGEIGACSGSPSSPPLGMRRLHHAGAFVEGFVPALTMRAIMVAVGAVAALLIPPLQRTTGTPVDTAKWWPPRDAAGILHSRSSARYSACRGPPTVCRMSWSDGPD